MHGLQASDLERENSDRVIARAIISDIACAIDAKISTLNAAGYLTVKFELPTNFAINQMSKHDAQLLVYSELVLMYALPHDRGGKGYPYVRIEICADRTYLHVAWKGGLSTDERKHRRGVIAQYMLR